MSSQIHLSGVTLRTHLTFQRQGQPVHRSAHEPGKVSCGEHNAPSFIRAFRDSGCSGIEHGAASKNDMLTESISCVKNGATMSTCIRLPRQPVTRDVEIMNLQSVGFSKMCLKLKSIRGFMLTNRAHQKLSLPLVSIKAIEPYQGNLRQGVARVSSLESLEAKATGTGLIEHLAQLAGLSPYAIQKSRMMES